MSGYAKQLATDRSRTPLQEFPAPYKALARYDDEDASVSSVMSLTHDTTVVEVAAVGGPAVIRWVPTSETAGVSPFASVISIAGATANFDHVVASGTIRRFVVPKETSNVQAGSAVGVNRQEGLYQRIAVKGLGISSVMTTEY